METHPAAAVERAVAGVRPDLAQVTVPAPTLAAYDALVRTG